LLTYHFDTTLLIKRSRRKSVSLSVKAEIKIIFFSY